MHMIAFLLAGTLLSSPEDKPNIPDYFDGSNGSNTRVVTMCNLNGEDIDGNFKTCRYDCGRTLTVGVHSVCPFVLQQ